jgi:hypothetical protein
MHTRAQLIHDALLLHTLTGDPLLMDSIRVLAIPKDDEITAMATANILACKQAYLTLYGGSGISPLDGTLTPDNEPG